MTLICESVCLLELVSERRNQYKVVCGSGGIFLEGRVACQIYMH